MDNLELSRRLRKWALFIELLSGYEFGSALTYSINKCPSLLLDGDLSVRAGSVVFLVGVGSLVCWKLWDFWSKKENGPTNEGDSPGNSPPPKVPSGRLFVKSPLKSTKNILTTLLDEEFIQDIGDFEDEDPALIQQLFDLGRLYLKSLIVGKYFGPDNPVERSVSPWDIFSLSGGSSANPAGTPLKLYQADNTTSYFADDDEGSETSDFDSLPFDETPIPKPTTEAPMKTCQNKEFLLSLSNSSETLQMEQSNGTYAAKETTDGLAKQQRRDQLKRSNAQSDYSPQVQRRRYLTKSYSQSPSNRLIFDLQRSETSNSSKVKNQNVSSIQSAKGPQIANYSSDDDWLYSDARLPSEDESIRRRSISRNASLNELMERIRYKRGRRMSLPRNNSISSNFSDILYPSMVNRRLPRDESLCSNLSDFAASECSEFSLDVSLKDESFANSTITSLADIEQELDFVKNTVMEMDEEFLRFTARPNPYLLRTTFSDASLASEESRPTSSLEINRNLINKTLQPPSPSFQLGDMAAVENKAPGITSSASQGSGAEGSFERDSPNHGWVPIKLSQPRFQRRSSSFGGLSRTSTQEEFPLSLEWDNEYMKQYEEVNGNDVDNTDLPPMSERKLYLPDHASLELDLEEELRSPSTRPSTFTELSARLNIYGSQFAKHEPQNPEISQHSQLYQKNGNLMSASVDSAICSAPGSRSGSSSPVPSTLSLSMMSSGIVASYSEISLDTPDSDTFWEIDKGFGNTSNSTSRKLLSLDESGYGEGEIGLGTSVTNLSPVHEAKENENAASKELASTSATVSDVKRIEKMGNFSSNNSQNNQLDELFPGREAIGDKSSIIYYANSEWQGNTTKAMCIRQGYRSIPDELGLHNLRRIRGDNYCGIRAVLFQALSSGIPIQNNNDVLDHLVSLLNKGSIWLKEYSFGKRLTYSNENIILGFKECLEALENTAAELQHVNNRDCVLQDKLNNSLLLDVQLCEALKLHMLSRAIDLHTRTLNGEDVPFFSLILFARQTCSSPKEFLKYHLNAVGDSGGLEQVDMILLGHALGVTIQVVRPSCFSCDDFICYFPDTHLRKWPTVTLVAEDDRHYNVLVQ